MNASSPAAVIQLPNQNAEVRAEYTETVVEAAPGDAVPTKLRREYRVAESTPLAAKGKPAPPGKLVPASFAGRTVVIEKKGESYTLKADGRDLTRTEVQRFADDFGRTRKVRVEDLLPTNPVRLGETWTPDPAAVKHLAAAVSFPVNPDRSTVTARFARVYPKDGRQFGVIEARTTLAVEGKGSAGPTGTLTFETTLDAVIDGSSHERTTRVNMTGTLNGRDKGVEYQVVLDSRQEQAVKPAK